MTNSASIDLVCIDPGMAILGWSAWYRGDLVNCGVITAPAHERQYTPWVRCSTMVTRLLEIPEVAMGRLEARRGVAMIVIESTGRAGIFIRKKKNGKTQTSPTSLRDVNIMIGSLLDRLRDAHANIEMCPRKTWAGGRSNARVKYEMKQWTGKQKMLQDAADAIAMGLWYIGQQRIRGNALNL